MSDGTHSTPSPAAAPPSVSNRLQAFKANKSAVIVSALGVAVLAGGLLIQVFRAETGAAADGGEEGAASNVGSATVSSSKQMARVGEQVITYDHLAAECVQRYAQDVLENMINRTIIQQACQQRGIQVTEAEVMQEVQKIAQKFKLEVDVWYQMLRAERNLTPIQYQRDIIWPMIALRKIAGENVAITNADRKKAFERDYGPRVEAKMIMLDNMRRAEEAWHKATQPDPSTGQPEDFGKLAREYSIEPTSKALGGDIPPIRMHIGSKSIIEEAFKLKPDEISGIIQAGPSRFVILKCEGRTKQIATYEEVRSIIEENLQEEKRAEAVAKVFEQLKQEIRVDNFVTNTTSGGVRPASATRDDSFPLGEAAPAGGAGRSPSRTANVRSPIRK